MSENRKANITLIVPYQGDKGEHIVNSLKKQIKSLLPYNIKINANVAYTSIF